MSTMHRYESAIAAHLSTVLLWISACVLLLLLSIGAFAQSPMRLKSFPDGHIIYTSPGSKYVRLTGSTLENKKFGYRHAANLNAVGEIGGLNARYRSSPNPLLRWKDAYPLSVEEMERRSALQARKEKPGNQLANGLLNSLLRRSQQTAVKPTF